MKSWKGGRLYTEIVVTEGIVRIRCRECMRWHTVRIVSGDLEVKSERLPDSIAV